MSLYEVPRMPWCCFGQGLHRKPQRSAAEGEHRTGEDAGRSRTLDRTQAEYASVWGQVEGKARRLLPDDRGRLAPLAGEGRGGVVGGLLSPLQGGYFSSLC